MCGRAKCDGQTRPAVILSAGLAWSKCHHISRASTDRRVGESRQGLRIGETRSAPLHTPRASALHAISRGVFRYIP